MASHAHGHTPVPEEHVDAWHHHTIEEGVPQHEHTAVASPVTLAKWFFGIVVGVVVTVIILKMFFNLHATKLMSEMFEHDRLAEGARGYKTAAFSELDKFKPIGATGWQIPIDKAMEKVVAEYSSHRQQGSAQPGH